MATTTLKTYHFKLTLGGATEITDAIEDAVLAAGCDDALLHSEGETLYLSFDREAPSFAEAVASAIRGAERAGLSVIKMEVEPEPPGDAVAGAG